MLSPTFSHQQSWTGEDFGALNCCIRGPSPAARCIAFRVVHLGLRQQLRRIERLFGPLVAVLQ